LSEGAVVRIYTCDSVGDRTFVVTSSEWLATGNRTKADLSFDVIVANDVNVPSGGGIVVSILVYGADEVYFYSQVLTGQTLNAGTYTFTFPVSVTDWGGASGTVTAFYGGKAATVEAGLHSLPASAEHDLIRIFEGALYAGTIVDADMYLRGMPTVAANGSLRCYPFKTYGTTEGSFWSRVKNGWTKQTTIGYPDWVSSGQGYPTWNTRFYDIQAATTRAWMTAGATDANEIDTAVYASLALTTGDNGVEDDYAVPLTASWLNDWQGDAYSLGFNLKHNGESGSDCFIDVESIALVVAYSALDANQIAGRKATTDTYGYAIAWTHNRYASSDVEHGFMAAQWRNADGTLDHAYVSPDGDVQRVSRNETPNGLPLLAAGDNAGIHFDPTDGRFWTAVYDNAAGEYGRGRLNVGYSEPYDLSTWTWKTHASLVTQKSTAIITDGDVLHIFAVDMANDCIDYLSYTCSTDTWSAETTLYAIGTYTERTLATAITAEEVMNGSGTITASGDVSTYPPFGSLRIDTEQFWYTGRSGSTFSGVTRDFFGTTAGAHSVGAAIERHMDEPSYVAAAWDSVRSGFHVTFEQNRIKDASNVEYLAINYLQFYPATGTAKDEAGNALSLPTSPTTIPTISTNFYPSFQVSIICTEAADVIIMAKDMTNPFAYDEAANDRYVLPYGETSFYYYQDPTIEAWGSCVDLGGERVALVYCDTYYGTSGTLKLSSSNDGGSTFPVVETLDAHTWPVASYTVPGISAQGKVLNAGLALLHHGTAHGALYLNVVQFPIRAEVGAIASVEAQATKSALAAANVAAAAGVSAGVRKAAMLSVSVSAGAAVAAAARKAGFVAPTVGAAVRVEVTIAEAGGVTLEASVLAGIGVSAHLTKRAVLQAAVAALCAVESAGSKRAALNAEVAGLIGVEASVQGSGVLAPSVSAAMGVSASLLKRAIAECGVGAAVEAEATLRRGWVFTSPLVGTSSIAADLDGDGSIAIDLDGDSAVDMDLGGASSCRL